MKPNLFPMTLVAAALTLAAAILPGAAQGAIVSYTKTESPLAIPDCAAPSGLECQGVGGATPGVAMSTLNVPDAFTFDDLNVKVEMEHTFIGDLRIELTSPGSTTVTLLDRPDHPNTIFGDGSDFSFNFPITYDDDSGNDPELMGTTIAAFEFVGDPGNGSPDTYFSFSGGLDTIPGPTMGNWTLTITDFAEVSTGSLSSYMLTFNTTDATPVPEPGTLTLFAFGLLGLAFVARRRRHQAAGAA